MTLRNHLKRWWTEWLIAAISLLSGILMLAQGQPWGFLYLGLAVGIAEMPYTHYKLTKDE